MHSSPPHTGCLFVYVSLHSKQERFSHGNQKNCLSVATKIRRQSVKITENNEVLLDFFPDKDGTSY